MYILLSSIFQAFARFSDQLSPLLEGCEDNRNNWAGLSGPRERTAQMSKTDADENDKENHDKDEGDDRETDPLQPTDSE